MANNATQQATPINSGITLCSMLLVISLLFLFACSSDEPSNGNQQGNNSTPSSDSNSTSSDSNTPSSDSNTLSSDSSNLSSDSRSDNSSSSVASNNSPSSSSSSAVVGGNGLCAGFADGTTREHYGKQKKQFCDERDGNKYVYVEIGTQTWMAENLNYDVPDNTTNDDRCYLNSPANCNTYGRLYNRATAMNNAPNSNKVPSGVKGVCPEGWHLPSVAEWNALITAVGGTSTAGTKLKAASGWNGGGNGTDDYGFSALPGGKSGDDIIGERAYWWTSNGTNENAIVRAQYNSNSLSFSMPNNELYSVRCVQGGNSTPSSSSVSTSSSSSGSSTPSSSSVSISSSSGSGGTGSFCNYGTCVDGNGWSCASGGCYRMPVEDNCVSGTLVSSCPAGTKPPSADY